MTSNMFAEFPDVLSAHQVCDLLPLGRNSVYDLLKTGKIQSLRKGSKYLVPKKCVIQYIEEELKTD